MFNNGIAGMLGRPDLMSGYGAYMAAPITNATVGGMGQTPASGGSFVGGNLSSSISGNVATGQLSLGLVAALIVFMMLAYMWTHGHQH